MYERYEEQPGQPYLVSLFYFDPQDLLRCSGIGMAFANIIHRIISKTSRF